MGANSHTITELLPLGSVLRKLTLDAAEPGGWVQSLLRSSPGFPPGWSRTAYVKVFSIHRG